MNYLEFMQQISDKMDVIVKIKDGLRRLWEYCAFMRDVKKWRDVGELVDRELIQMLEEFERWEKRIEQQAKVSTYVDPDEVGGCSIDELIGWGEKNRERYLG